VFAITLHTMPESAAAAMPLHRMGWS
jgi:zinc transporter ZupT